MAVLSASFGGLDLGQTASGVLRPYDNQGPTDDQSVLVLTKTVLASQIALTFNPIKTSTENRTFTITQPAVTEILAVGQTLFGSTTSFVVPAGVTTISAVVVGAGGGGVYSGNGGSGGAGGDLRYSTSIAVVPGETLTINVGVGGAIGTITATSGGFSSIVRVSNGTTLLSAAGGGGGRQTSTPNVQNGSSTGIGGVVGGGTGGRAATATTISNTSGGGGAGGYSGAGGAAGVGAVAGAASVGFGGGGGGGNGSGLIAGNGGGVGILGSGPSNGTAGAIGGAGGAGSAGSGQTYGGGGRGSDTLISTNATAGGNGAVRIIWGSGRSYPSTVTSNQTTVAYRAFVPPTGAPEIRSVTLTNQISFPIESYVTITDPSISYATSVQVTQSTSGSIQFTTPINFPNTLSASARIEGASPSRYPQSYSKSRLLSTPRPYSLSVTTDYLAAGEIAPVDRSIKLYNRSIYLDFTAVQRDSRGKVSSVNTVKSPEQVRKLNTIDRFKITADKISDINIVRPTDNIDAENTLGDQFWIAAKAPTGILSRSGTTFTLPIGGNAVADPKLPDSTGTLTPYVEPGLYAAEVYPVSGQSDIKWSSVNNYIYDLNVISIEPSGSSEYLTVYFNTNIWYPVVPFPIGTFVRIVYPTGNFEAVVEVLATTITSITFASISGFPTDYTGGMTIQSATVFSYPKDRVFDQLITQQYPFDYILSPRENLFVSEYRPIQQSRTISYFIGRDFADNLPVLSSTAHKLNTFDTDSRLPADFIVKIIGETTEIKYNTNIWYQEDLDIISYNSVPIEQKVLFFADQSTLLFKPGDTVRLYNSNINYSQYVMVLASTNRSVTIDIPMGYPGMGDLYIETLTTSVYPQRYVSLYPGKLPTTPRENLFYFEFLPSLRAARRGLIFSDTVPSKLVGSVTTFIKVKSDTNVLKSNSLEKDIAKVKGIASRVSIAAFSPVAIVKGDSLVSPLTSAVNSYTDQRTVRPTTSPTTASERFYYFTLSQGYRSNSSLQQGTVFSHDANSYTVDKLRSVTRVLSDNTQINADKINLYKTSAVSLFDSPKSENLAKPVIKVTTLGNFFNVPKLAASAKLISTEYNLIKVDNLKAMTVLKPVYSDFISADINSYYDQYTVVPQGFPSTARDNFFYFNLAPGYNANNSIQQGLAFAPNNILDFDKIEFLEYGSKLGSPTPVVVLESRGEILKLKTTSYQDIAAPKKDPIQFWN